MTTPTEVPTPPVQPAPEAVAAAVEAVAASKKDRAKKFATTVASRVGVPILVGTAAAYVATRRLNRQQESENTLELTSSTDE